MVVTLVCGAAAETVYREADQERLELGDFESFSSLPLFKSGEFGSYSIR